MSIPALLELNDELKRLAVAGAAVASGDFRVKRLIPALQKSGLAVPVFARAAELAERLTADDEAARSARFLELANLVNAVLATQGKTGIEGEGDFVPFSGGKMEFTTFLSCRKLKPVEDALTQGSSGRMEVLRQAQTEGAFRDFRLAAPLARALSDSYAELNAFAVDRLAEYGGDIVPYLKKDFDPQGGKAHARRVETVCKAVGEGENDWYRSVAEAAEGPVKAEAVYALRHCRANEDILISHTFDRKKEVREAAFSALGFMESEAASKRFIEAFDGKDRAAAMAGIARCPAGSLAEHLMRRAEAALKSLVQSGKVHEAERKKTCIGYADPEAAALSDAFEALLHKTHPDLLPFYSSFEPDAALLTWLQAGPDTGLGVVARQWARNVLYLGAICPGGSIDAQAGPPERFALLDGLLGRFGNYFVDCSFAAAVASGSSEEVFERYAPVLKMKKTDAAALMEIFLCTLEYTIDVPVRERYTTLQSVNIIKAAKPAWDGRWLDVFIDIDAGELAARMARKGHRKCGDYLIGKLAHALQNPREEPGPWVYAAGLIQMEHDKSGSLALHALEVRLAAKDYMPKYDPAVLRLLPGDCADKMMALAAKHGDRALAEIAEQVKKNPETEKKRRFGLF